MWIDDSKSNQCWCNNKCIGSIWKNKKIHLILGGDDKGANLEPLFQNINSMDILVYAIGTNSDRIISYCKSYSIKYFECNYLNIAVEKWILIWVMIQ